MKVLVISPTYWPAFSYGGPIQSLHLLCRHLQKTGADITVYTTLKGQRKEIIPNTRELVDDVNVHYFAYSKYLDVLNPSGWNFSLPFVNALKNNITEFDIVYILSVWNFTTAAAAYYCRKFKIPYVLSPRGQLYDYVLGTKSWKKIPYFKLISARDINYAAAVHYTTYDEYENVHLKLGFKNRPLIVPNGIDLSEYTELPNKGSFIKDYKYLREKKIIIFLGRLDPKKGIDILLKSFSNLYKKDKNIHLVLAGSGQNYYKNSLITIVNQYNMNYIDFEHSLNKNNINDTNLSVTFTGYLDDTKKKEALIDSTVFILPSYSENFGMSVIEAMACGTPVIISNRVGIFNEVAEYSSGSVISCDVNETEKAIKEVLDSRKIQIEYTKNAKRLLSDKYDITTVAKAFSAELIRLKRPNNAKITD